MQEKYGISREDYSRLLGEAKSAFQMVTGVDYFEAKQGADVKAFLNLPFTKHVFDQKKMAVVELNNLRKIVSVAWKHLNTNQFSAVTARLLFRAPEKLNFEEISCGLGRATSTVKTKDFQAGRLKLIDALKIEAPDLADHPLLHRAIFDPIATKPIPEIDVKTLIGANPQRRYLYALSETLFVSDTHYIASHAILAKDSIPRDYGAIADTLGISRDAVRLRVQKIRETLNDAIAFEPSSLKLKVPNRLPRLTHHHSGNKQTNLDESLIDLDIPFIKDVYERACSLGVSKNELFVFCAAVLYRADERMDLETIYEKYGITVSTSNGYFKKVRRKVAESYQAEGSDLEYHPIISKRPRHMQSPQAFMGPNDIPQLREARGTKELKNISSVLFGYTQHYALTKREMCVPAPSFAELSQEMGISEGSLRNSVKRARTLMLKALEYEGTPETVYRNLIVKRWAKMAEARDVTSKAEQALESETEPPAPV